MKRLIIVLALALCACATTPKGSVQMLYSAEQTLIAAVNSVADLHDNGTLKGADYDNAKQVILQAKSALDSAKLAKDQGNTTDAQKYVGLAQTLLLQLSAVLANSEKK